MPPAGSGATNVGSGGTRTHSGATRMDFGAIRVDSSGNRVDFGGTRADSGGTGVALVAPESTLVDSGGSRVDLDGTRVDAGCRRWLWQHHSQFFLPPESILMLLVESGATRVDLARESILVAPE